MDLTAKYSIIIVCTWTLVFIMTETIPISTDKRTTTNKVVFTIATILYLIFTWYGIVILSH